VGAQEAAIQENTDQSEIICLLSAKEREAGCRSFLSGENIEKYGSGIIRIRKE
jgi:hypothetical protein